MEPYGGFSVHMLASPDDGWHSEKGDLEQLKRRDKVERWRWIKQLASNCEAFLAKDIPTAVAKRARDYLPE